MKFTFSLQEIDNIAEKIVHLSSSKIFLFNGAMGAGKTTFIKALAKQMGINDIANSPTFSIVNEYHTNEGQPLYHFDLYRLKNEEEAYDIGLDEYFYSGNYCFIEWPEKASHIIPEQYHTIDFEIIDENTRRITFI
ncbi:tRNA (adenosine(37)-N6)-threonylcarbamoyltransferase complex ATPase subunit type 1 TsaE [Myroides ceti]|uniref:tRNA threonylcarbamoyladenosine biosynthesis protein TsaE n=1 Tax=Paenimyroides ceti TaxID=395087 RepID=A0ABT8CU40_9FLAO|nr:tRNA (adenosine(37)-N6)-threonylcarbamoyltransferase complex ATPase subunit type 1 TsaE [Paenimyroides ceti]MDN3707506.1 tRNA (adenosine(37)-N6)-threonylcarbamoyltransferase complex ATPase subunit type 1 TsaE [Paenimyroides ceti]